MSTGIHVTQRCHNRNPRWEMGLGSVNDVTHWKILEILKKLVELRTRHRTRRVDFRGSQRPDEFARYGNSKVIKGFVPELRSCYVFFVFWDSYILCIYVMNILCTFHISVSWVWYKGKLWNICVLFAQIPMLNDTYLYHLFLLDIRVQGVLVV